MRPAIVFTRVDGKGTEQTVTIPHRISVDSGFVARRMAEEGCGVVMVPDIFVRQRLDDGSLVEVLPDWRAPSYGIYAVRPPNSGTNRLRNSFLDFIAAIARKETDSDTHLEMGRWKGPTA